MRNLFKYLLVFILLVHSSTLKPQSNKILYHYKGSAGIGSINITDNVLLCFDRAITGRYYWTGTGVFNTGINSDIILNNQLLNVNRVLLDQSKITFTITDIPVEDYYLNNVLFDVSAGYNSDKINFKIDYDNMSTTVDINNGTSAVNGSFPVIRNNLPSSVLKYLNASALVESTNTTIANTATSITSGCTDLRTAVLKLCKWIEANILMDGRTANPSNQSSVVFANKYADCDGVAHLLAAFCRSLNIPARIVSGYYIEKAFLYPISKTSTITWGSGNGTTMDGHAACEIYIPFSNNWVRCDPAQRTVFYGVQNFIKMATGTESTNQLQYGYGPFTYHWTQSVLPQITGFELNPTVNVSSSGANFSFIKSEMFPGTSKTNNNGYLFCAADPSVALGFNDKVTIQDPLSGTNGPTGQVPNNTYLMIPCSPANFYAKFVTESTPATYSTSFDWALVLYRSNGDEYIYAQQNGVLSNAYNPNEFGEGCFWQPNIGTLPAYDWLYDPSGNIYGKVKVTVHINDGDTKNDEITIGVSSYNNIHDVTYNTDTTVDACAELNLTNVTISGTPIVIFNTNGLEMIINGAFEAPVGSTLIINK